MSELTVSFEFFPPKTEKGMDNLRTVRNELAEEVPNFFSVTYGAGGSTQDRTFSTVSEFNALETATAPHLTCVGATVDGLHTLLKRYQDIGVNRIVALRGDLPSGTVGGTGEFRYASDLVAFLKSHYGDAFKIEVAAYPEMHPQAPNFNADIDNFVTKAKAGADSAITQYFFNPDAYFHFVEQVQKRGVDIPIIPGIMPIINFSNLARFSDACGAEIPRWIRKQLESYGDDVASIQKFGEEVVSELTGCLIDGGAPGIHFYTMNKSAPTLNVMENLGLRLHQQEDMEIIS